MKRIVAIDINTNGMEIIVETPVTKQGLSPLRSYFKIIKTVLLNNARQRHTGMNGEKCRWLLPVIQTHVVNFCMIGQVRGG
jgi:hypothetical protein